MRLEGFRLLDVLDLALQLLLNIAGSIILLWMLVLFQAELSWALQWISRTLLTHIELKGGTIKRYGFRAYLKWLVNIAHILEIIMQTTARMFPIISFWLLETVR